MIKAKGITENYAINMQKLDANLTKDLMLVRESTSSILEVFSISFALESKLDTD